MTRALLAGLGALALVTAGTGNDPTAEFRFERTIATPAPGQVCAPLDAAVYAHAAATLEDLRLYGGAPEAGRAGALEKTELPFALTLSGTAETETETAQVRNARQQVRGVAFDLVMPARPYSEVVLDLQGSDFAALAHVSGSGSEGETGARPTELGEFPIFDLTSQGEPRSTTLHLQETSLPELHVLLTPLPGSAAWTPARVLGATVPPSRQAQTIYTAAVSTTAVQQKGRDTVAHLTLPAKVPIERIRFTLAPGFKGSFSRRVTITGRPDGDRTTAGEVLTGEIDRMRVVRDGVVMATDQLTVPATLGANLQSDAQVQVSISNGGEAPLPLRSVVLESRQREICFQAAAGMATATLLYGSVGAPPPEVSLQSRFHPGDRTRVATLGPEKRNPHFAPVTKRAPRMLYLGLMLAVCGVGVLALRFGKPRF